MTETRRDTRNMTDVLKEALVGADRVVVETKNALGEMDAHYLHAPSLLSDLATPTVQEARIAELESKLEKARAGLERIASWRNNCHEYDRDMGHELRFFDIDDVIMMECNARMTLRALSDTKEGE